MKRVLLIEDDADQRELLKTVLSKAGYDVTEAPDGEEGLRLFYQNPCELIITDIFMPEREGLELILEIRAQYPTVRIIAISGGTTWTKNSGADVVLETAEKFGANAIFKKPIKIQTLLEKVNELSG